MSYKDEVSQIIKSMENEESQDNPQTPPIEDVYVFIVRETDTEAEDQSNIVDSAPAPSTTQFQKISFIPAYAICSFYLFLIFSCIAFQAYEILNPPIATITIIPKSQTVTLSGTLHLGRLLQPITISQSQTTPTTGKGHQPATQAAGLITFYNGQLNSVTVATETILTGSSGVQIATNQDAVIPPESQTIPPTLGHITVSAHALVPGIEGNIPTGDINQGCCATSVLVQNTTSFHGGLDERNFQTVRTSDISSVASPLKTTVMQSMKGALQGQIQPPEQLFILPCSPTVTPNRNVGDEAIQVKVTVSETCTAAAYNSNDLTMRATQLLTTQAYKKLGSDYSLFGTANVYTVQATTTPNLVFLSFKATGIWVYGLSAKAQESIKSLIAGKSKDQALQILAAMPGIERAYISFTGFTDDTKLPKNSSYIHIILIVM
jgi:hypothetical protein